MSTASKIEWTETTWNPVTGCDRISPGCDHCYALTLAKRLKAMGQARYQADGDPRTSGPGFAVTCHPEALAMPYRWRAPRLVFVNSMSDLCHARVPEPFIRDVFAVMADTPATPTRYSPSGPAAPPGSPPPRHGRRTCGSAYPSKPPATCTARTRCAPCPPPSGSSLPNRC